jgi:hypothetical protein
VRYARPDTGLPSSFFLKTLIDTVDEVDDLLATIRAGTGPSMYETEVRFYRELRPTLRTRTPEIFASEYFPEDGRFLLLMEDLLEKSVRFPTASTPVSLAETASVLDTLASLHAQYWSEERFDGELSWLDGPLSGAFITFIRDIGPSLFATESGFDFKSPFVSALGVTSEQLFDAFWRLQADNATAVPTLLHGDPHFANLYALPDGTCGLLDWALLRRGCWAHDVSYFLGGSLPVEVRREAEKRLLSGYLDALSGYGAPAPAFDDAWDAYCRNMLWGFVIWALTPAPIHPPERISANLERFTAALADHDVLARLGVEGQAGARGAGDQAAPRGR